MLKKFDNVAVESFEGLLVHFAARRRAHIVVRGLRAVSDFEYELQLANMNHKMFEELETLFLPADEMFGYVSSTLVREIAMMSGDPRPFVDPIVAEAFDGSSPPWAAGAGADSPPPSVAGSERPGRRSAFVTPAGAGTRSGTPWPWRSQVSREAAAPRP